MEEDECQGCVYLQASMWYGGWVSVELEAWKWKSYGGVEGRVESFPIWIKVNGFSATCPAAFSAYYKLCLCWISNVEARVSALQAYLSFPLAYKVWGMIYGQPAPLYNS